MSEFNEMQQPAPEPVQPPAKKEVAGVAWEQKTLEKIVLFSLKEQRAARRWKIAFRIIGVVIIALFLIGIFSSGPSVTPMTGPHVGLVSVDGEISAGGENSAEMLMSSLDKAFTAPGIKGVILKINSPGGSPVQSGLVYDEIRRLRALHKDIPLYVVIEDLGASGGYFIASAGDKIYANSASLVGSIGVRMDGFDLTGLMEKLGVQRRLLTAGENKGMMDPFTTATPQQLAYMHDMLEDIHQQFIKAVRDGRGKRLKETPDMFSGLIWTGAKAKELGLVDEIGSVDSVVRDVFKLKDVVDYTETEDISQRFLKRFGAAIGEGAVAPLLREELNRLR